MQERGHRTVKSACGLRRPGVAVSLVETGDSIGSITPREDYDDLGCEIPGPGTVEGHRFFWQIKVEEAGATGFVVIGLGLRSFNPLGGHVWPGGAASGVSWGYHGADGAKLLGGKGFQYGDTFTSGDVIGVYLNLEHGTITFTKNGALQSTAFTSVPVAAALDFFPSVSLHDPGQSLLVLDTDPKGYSLSTMSGIYNGITTVPMELAGPVPMTVPLAIESHLLSQTAPGFGGPHRGSHQSLHSLCSNCSGSRRDSRASSRTGSVDGDSGMDGASMLPTITVTGNTTEVVGHSGHGHRGSAVTAATASGTATGSVSSRSSISSHDEGDAAVVGKVSISKRMNTRSSGANGGTRQQLSPFGHTLSLASTGTGTANTNSSNSHDMVL